MLIAENKDLKTIQGRLGHVDAGMTLNVYGHHYGQTRSPAFNLCMIQCTSGSAALDCRRTANSPNASASSQSVVGVRKVHPLFAGRTPDGRSRRCRRAFFARPNSRDNFGAHEGSKLQYYLSRLLRRRYGMSPDHPPTVFLSQSVVLETIPAGARKLGGGLITAEIFTQTPSGTP
jgi:hypothetical protein